jgi:hypothetical protein
MNFIALVGLPHASGPAVDDGDAEPLLMEVGLGSEVERERGRAIASDFGHLRREAAG